MKIFLKKQISYPLQQAISISFAVGIAMFLVFYFSINTQQGWLAFSAFLVCQTTRGTMLTQAMLFFLMIILAVLSAYGLAIINYNNLTSALIASLFIICSCYILLARPTSSKKFYLVVFFPLIMLIAASSPVNTVTLLQDRLVNIFVGAAIGLVCAQFIFPISFFEEFRRGVIPILRAALIYSQVFSAVVTRKNNDFAELKSKKIALEQTLQATSGMYPEWVFEVGFNPGLRASFRYFLLHLERVTDLFFAMDYLAPRDVANELIVEMSSELEIVMQKNEELMHILIHFFETKQLINIQSDFTSDMTELETVARKLIPDNIELLDVSPDYLAVAALVRDIKDMRNLLLQLVMSVAQAPA